MLREFLQGFVASTTEMIVFGVVVAAFIAALVLYTVVRNRRNARRRHDRAEARYRELVQEQRLRPSDEDAVETLSTYLRRPERPYLVLQNQGVFDECAARALDDETLTEGHIAGLRVRLGFAGRRSGTVPQSSTELPEGAGLILKARQRDPISVKVRGHEPSALIVLMDDEETPLTAGRLVEVLYQDASGVYVFSTTVLSREGTELRLAHSENLSRIQRRDYVRRQMKLPVYVRQADSGRKPVLSRFLDLSGGGARVRNPGMLEPGDDVELTFHQDSSASLHVPAHVVRNSRAGRVSHLEFRELSPHARDRIVGLVHRGSGGPAE